MKNLTHKITLASLASLVLAFPLSALAAEGPYLGFELGGNWTRQQHLTQNGFNFVNIDTKQPLDSGLLWGVKGGWSFANGLRPELEYSERSNELKSFNARLFDGGGNLEGHGKENAESTFANLWYDFQPVAALGNLRPYFGGGIGRTRIRVRNLEAGGVPFGSSSASVNAWQLGAGVAYDIKPNWVMSLDLRHLKADTGNFGSIQNIPPGDVHAGYAANSLNLGLHYQF